jgi:hypothetical protein
MRSTNPQSSPTIIPDSTVATPSVSSKTITATDKKQQQKTTQTISCTADGEQKSEAVKGERELSI